MRARSEIALVHRRLRLLGLEEQRIVVRATDEQADEGSEPDAADADDLEREVRQPIPIEEDAPVLLQRLAICAQGRIGQWVGHVAELDERRGMLHDAALAVDERGELGQFVDGVVMGGRLDRPLDHRARRFVGVGEDPRGVDARVVHVDGAHRRVARHAFAV